MYGLPALKLQLSAIARELADPEFLLPRSNDEAAVTRRGDTLRKMQADLEDILKRRIPLVEAAIKSEEGRIKSVPHDEQWGSQHRVKQLARELDEVCALAGAIANKVRELLIKNGALDLGQKVKAYHDLAESAEKSFGHWAHAEILKEFSVPVYQRPSQVHSSVADMVPLIVLACVGLKHLAEKFRPARRQEPS